MLSTPTRVVENLYMEVYERMRPQAPHDFK
jgi:hypothetical protein